jgi:hypothetical protein
VLFSNTYSTYTNLILNDIKVNGQLSYAKNQYKSSFLLVFKPVYSRYSRFLYYSIILVSMLFAENRITEKKDRRKSMVCFYAFVWEFRRSECSAIFLFGDEVHNLYTLFGFHIHSTYYLSLYKIQMKSKCLFKNFLFNFLYNEKSVMEVLLLMFFETIR